MKTVFHEASSRGYATHGWLTTHYSFSFASFYDPTKMGFGALRVLNDDSIAPDTGFERHPHDNMEIITIPLSGSLRHEDSMGAPAVATPGALLAGNSAVIETGEVQVMSAGTGVFHAEYNASVTESLALLQIWILSAKRDVAPHYDQRRFDPESYRGKLLQVVGQIGETGMLGIHQDAKLSLGEFVAGQKLTYALERDHHGVYLFVIEGTVIVAGKKIQDRDAVGVWDTEQVDIFIEKNTRLLAIEVPMG